MVFHSLNILIFLFNIFFIVSCILESDVSFFKKLFVLTIVSPIVVISLPGARFLFKWIQKWYYFIAKPLPYILSSEFQKWMAYQLGPAVLALLGSGIFSLLLSFKVIGYFIPIKGKDKFHAAPSSKVILTSTQTPPQIPAGYQLARVKSDYMQVTIRSEPWDLASSPGNIPENSYLFIQDFGGPWIKVKDPYSNLEGFLARQQLSITNCKVFPENINGNYKKSILSHSSQSLRIMESPSAKSSSVCEVRADEVIYVQDAETDWLHAKRPRTGEDGFVEKSLIRFVK